MNIPNDILVKEAYLKDWSILVGWRGSIAHGMYVPKEDPNSIDDKDVMAIVVPPINYYYGLENFGSRGTKDVFIREYDIVTYEVKKFVSLLTKGNPNVLSLLWLDPNYYIFKNDAGQLLLDSRNLFVTKEAYHSFIGYAHSQLHKMTHQAFEGYMGKKRKELVEKFGYDCKNAAHLIRLLRMGIEFLNEGRLHVMRQDNQQLLEIKKGEWALEQVKDEAARLFKRAEEAYDKSTLPITFDKDRVNQLLIDVTKAMHEIYEYY